MWFPLTHSPLGTWLAPWHVPLTRNQTGDPLIHRLALNHWATPARARFSLYTTKTYHNRMNAKACMRTQVFSIKPDIGQISKNVKQCHSLNFLLLKLFFIICRFIFKWISKYFLKYLNIWYISHISTIDITPQKHFKVVSTCSKSAKGPWDQKICELLNWGNLLHLLKIKIKKEDNFQFGQTFYV